MPAGTHVVVLGVADEDALWDVHSDLIQYGPMPPGIRSDHWNGYHIVIHDPDPPKSWDRAWGASRDGLKRGGAGEATAIGVPPTRDRKWVKKALGRLKLLS